jgi:hypothetical protein
MVDAWQRMVVVSMSQKMFRFQVHVLEVEVLGQPLLDFESKHAD